MKTAHFVAAACAAGGVTDGEWLPIDEVLALKLEPEQVEARVERSVLGEAIFAHFRRIAEFTPEIKPLYCEIMPDHLHMILHVVRPMKRPLGNAIAGFKTGCEKIYAKMGGEGRLCQWIAGEGAAEINYHGIKLENIDNLVLKAVSFADEQVRTTQ